MVHPLISDESFSAVFEGVDQEWASELLELLERHETETTDCQLLYGVYFLQICLTDLLSKQSVTRNEIKNIENVLKNDLPEITKIVENHNMDYECDVDLMNRVLKSKRYVLNRIKQSEYPSIKNFWIHYMFMDSLPATTSTFDYSTFVAREEEELRQIIESDTLEAQWLVKFCEDHNRELIDYSLLYSAVFVKVSLQRLLSRQPLTRAKRDLILNALQHHLPEIIKIVQNQNLNYKSDYDAFNRIIALKNLMKKALNVKFEE